MSPADPLLDRILNACRMSGGTMPICIVVADLAEQRRGEQLLKGRHNNAAIGFAVGAELDAAWAATTGGRR